MIAIMPASFLIVTALTPISMMIGPTRPPPIPSFIFSPMSTVPLSASLAWLVTHSWWGLWGGARGLFSLPFLSCSWLFSIFIRVSGFKWLWIRRFGKWSLSGPWSSPYSVSRTRPRLWFYNHFRITITTRWVTTPSEPVRPILVLWPRSWSSSGSFLGWWWITHATVRFMPVLKTSRISIAVFTNFFLYFSLIIFLCGLSLALHILIIIYKFWFIILVIILEFKFDFV